jgi:hypothetical protein
MKEGPLPVMKGVGLASMTDVESGLGPRTGSLLHPAANRAIPISVQQERAVRVVAVLFKVLTPPN